MQLLRWWRSDSSLSPEARRMLNTLNELADEKDRLTQDLAHAVDTIKTLQDQLAEYDFLLKQAQSRLAQRATLSSRSDNRRPQSRGSTADTTSNDQDWIQNTWLCLSEDSKLLGEAENTWKSGHPQRAINALSLILSTRGNLSLADKFKCQLLMAAIFHCDGNYDGSNQLLNTVLEKTQDRLIPNYTHTMELAGIARFIQGKNFMARGDWNEAFWSLTRALYTPGYHGKAQQLQDEAMHKLESDAGGEDWIPTIRALSSHSGSGA